MSTKVSVIIPVYNAEKYLVPCIESLISQTLGECEFIFVNDGSQDGSAGIIERFAELDSRIRLIHQDNQGVSIARNHGIRLAKGEYVGFVDSDDYVEKDMFETLYTSVKTDNYDVAISNFESELEGRKVLTNYPFPSNKWLSREFIEQEILPFLLKSDQLNTACNKLYRRSLIVDYDIKFPERVALGEDGMFNIQIFKHAAQCIYIDYTGYHYREVIGSATRDIAKKDYFGRSIEVYRQDTSTIFANLIDPNQVRKMKSIKLITSVMAYIYVYLDSTNGLNLTNRIRTVGEMIGNSHVRDALPIYYTEMYPRLGRYEKFIVTMIHRQSVIGLLCAVTYSRVRNKSS